MQGTNKKFYFYSSNFLTIESIVSIVNRNYPRNILNAFAYEDHIKLILDDSYTVLKLLPCDTKDSIKIYDIPFKFEIDGDDMRILAVLFSEVGLLFYDEDYKESIEFLDEEKDRRYYDILLREYITNCMIHYGVIKSMDDINEKLYGNSHRFYNEYEVDKAKYIQIKRIESELKKTKIAIFFNKIKRFFKKLF